MMNAPMLLTQHSPSVAKNSHPWDAVLGILQAEIDFLMQLYEGFIRDNVDEFCREGIRLHLIGDSPGRPASLLRAAREAHQATRNNSEMVLMLAIGYSGRRDIVRACQELAAEVQRDLLRPEDIDEALIAGGAGDQRRRRRRALPLLPRLGHQDQRRAEAEQLPAVAVRILGALLL